MSLGIVFKGPEGIVLAADSRVTLTTTNQIQPPPAPPLVVSSTFDNATKLLKIKGQDYVGAVTYGLGAIGQNAPRTAHSFLPELEVEMAREKRLSVEAFAKKLSAFFMSQWAAASMPAPTGPGQDMVFHVAGYDEGAPYGRIFEFFIPSNPTPHELIAGEFGACWGGQREITDRLLCGFDARTIQLAREFLNVPAPAATQGNPDPLETELKGKLTAKIPWAFLPLQDCVDLSIFLLRATITLQRWVMDVRGVGGAIDVATVTRTNGFSPVQIKSISGEKA